MFLRGISNRVVMLLVSKSQGGDSNIKMPGCVCLVFENRPILNETLSCKTHPY